MNTAKALFQRVLRLPKAAGSGHQTRHFTVSPPSLRAANHRRRGYPPPSSFPFPPEPLPAWFSKPPKLPHGVETWEIVLVLGLPVVIIGWLQYTQRVWGWEDPEKRVVWEKAEPLELFVRIRRPFFRRQHSEDRDHASNEREHYPTIDNNEQQNDLSIGG
ncbi:hypothetical protein KC316_g253 [Hortaea werneckii]|nr:hypothetical protein KC324_g298 [Hortaea werneckii]KAI7595845.1 hypothetical protein KC316_g253 [Hortaea werneckii]